MANWSKAKPPIPVIAQTLSLLLTLSRKCFSCKWVFSLKTACSNEIDQFGRLRESHTSRESFDVEGRHVRTRRTGSSSVTVTFTRLPSAILSVCLLPNHLCANSAYEDLIQHRTLLSNPIQFSVALNRSSRLHSSGKLSMEG